MNRTCYDVEVQGEGRVKNALQFSALSNTIDRDSVYSEGKLEETQTGVKFSY